MKFLKSIARFIRTGSFSSPKMTMTLLKDSQMARITKLNDTFALTLNGQVVATYSRARDAKRGARRRGLTVA